MINKQYDIYIYVYYILSWTYYILNVCTYACISDNIYAAAIWAARVPAVPCMR